MRIGVEMAHHVFVDSAEAHSDGPVAFVVTSSVQTPVSEGTSPPWIWNADVIRYISHLIMSAFDGGGNESARTKS